MKISLTRISDELIKLNDAFAIQYPKFYESELLYTVKKAQVLMSQEVAGLGSQPQRDAAAERILSKTDEYINYHSLKPEIDVINMQIKVYMQLSRNINSPAWEEYRG